MEDHKEMSDRIVAEAERTSEPLAKDGAHNIKIRTNRFIKEAKEDGIPVFVAYYLPETGYRYGVVLPEDCGEPFKSECEKFVEFAKVCIGFNKTAFKQVSSKGRAKVQASCFTEEEL